VNGPSCRSLETTPGAHRQEIAHAVSETPDVSAAFEDVLRRTTVASLVVERAPDTDR
jgi:hypothetical protein